MVSVLLVVLMLTVLAAPVLASGYSRTLQFGYRGEDVLKLQKIIKPERLLQLHPRWDIWENNGKGRYQFPDRPWYKN